MTSKQAPNAKNKNPAAAPAKLSAKAPTNDKAAPFTLTSEASAYREYLKFQNPGASGSSDLMRWLRTETEPNA